MVVPSVSLKSEQRKATKEQLDAVGGLMDSMWVEKDVDTMEKFTRAPDRQYLWNVKAARALHPDDPLPPPDQYLLDLLEPPNTLDLAKVEGYAKKIKDVFKLVENTDKAVEAKMYDISQMEFTFIAKFAKCLFYSIMLDSRLNN